MVKDVRVAANNDGRSVTIVAGLMALSRRPVANGARPSPYPLKSRQ
jgi:hypothetical protein